MRTYVCVGFPVEPRQSEGGTYQPLWHVCDTVCSQLQRWRL